MRDLNDPECVGDAIKQYMVLFNCSVTEAADRLYADLTTKNLVLTRFERPDDFAVNGPESRSPGLGDRIRPTVPSLDMAPQERTNGPHSRTDDADYREYME